MTIEHDLDDSDTALYALALLAHRNGGSIFVPVTEGEPEFNYELTFDQDGITCDTKVITDG